MLEQILKIVFYVTLVAIFANQLYSLLANPTATQRRMINIVNIGSCVAIGVVWWYVVLRTKPVVYTYPTENW